MPKTCSRFQILVAAWALIQTLGILRNPKALLREQNWIHWTGPLCGQAVLLNSDQHMRARSRPPLPPGNNLLIGIRFLSVAGERPTNPLRSDNYVNQV
jgi:hypothetical protein